MLPLTDGALPAQAELVTELDVDWQEDRLVIARFPAEVVAIEPADDLAIVRFETEGRIAPARLGDTDDLRLGQTVVAVGFSLGLEGGPSVTMGIVSSLDRSITLGDGTTYEDLIQIDAPINACNSGGPLLDVAGEVVGINTAAVAAGYAENVGFAVPVEAALALIDQAE